MSSKLTAPFRMLPIFRERVWGQTDLSPYFTDIQAEQPIGEAWFTSDENETSLGVPLKELIREHPEMLGTAADMRHPELCPLLVKLLFTTSRLSVQVHPDDEYAKTHHQSLGKTEAWYVLAAQPPGEVAIGFRKELQPGELQRSALSGEIEDLLDWRKVEAGDVIFTPAGTVHAIGGGLTVCEIQQNSDVTYRLYDYGRPRELHLEHGCNVAKVVQHDHEASPVDLTDWRTHLLDCSYFRIERLRPQAPLHFEADLPYYLLLVCSRGKGTIGGQPFRPGETWMTPAGNSEFVLDGAGSEWILTYAADRALAGLRVG